MNRHCRPYQSRKNDRGAGRYKLIWGMLLLLLVICGCEKKQEAVPEKEEKSVVKPAAFIQRGAITIGLNLPLTGPYADQGRDQLRAFELAVKELNQVSGILDMRVESVVRDTQSNPEVAANNAVELIDQHGAVMITGGVSCAVAIAVGKVCHLKKTIFMATVTHSDATTGSAARRYMFRKCTGATMDVRALASILAKYYADGSDYFYITADYTWGHTTESAMINTLNSAGANTVGTVKTPLGNSDFTEALHQASAAKPDVLVLVLFGDDFVYAIKQLSAAGLKERIKLLVVPYIELNMALKAGADALQGIIASAPWYWQLSKAFPKAKVFVDSFFEMYGQMPSNCAESAYVNVMQYAEAAERVGSFNSVDVVRALEGHRFTGLKDWEYWRQWDHQSIQTLFLLKSKRSEDMVNEYDLFEIIYRVSGDEVARSQSENPVVLEPLE